MILFLLTLLTLLLFYNFRYKRQHLPPGPTPWPIMGNVFEMGRSPSWNRLFYEWKVRYGGIYTYWLGETPIVNVCDYRLAVELAVKNADAYADRVQLPHSDFAMRGGILGIVSTNDEMWREHRRFVMKVLRDFGMGKNKIQEHASLSYKSLAQLHKSKGPVVVTFN
uniref:Cytochrome P450 n=1 Tax=Bursaphelenchus xylophilus TaxID=6326 RepID=A0A1I7SHR5_BURXY